LATLGLSDLAPGAAQKQGHNVHLFGALFISIAYQPFVCMLIALQIALVEHVRRRMPPSPHLC
jgi:hypothetical protein